MWSIWTASLMLKSASESAGVNECGVVLMRRVAGVDPISPLANVN